jgi:two-component system cell cycle response regulator
MTAPPRILLVDDEPVVRRTYEALIKKKGFEVVAVASAREVLELLGPGHGFHLLVSDLNMPEIDGLELVRQLRRTPRLELLPVLMLTGSTEQEDVIWSLEAGATDYVAKDCNRMELLARVHSHARTGQLQEQLDRVSRTDELTQLFNRRHGTQRLTEEMARSNRYEGGLAVVLLDVDHFKRVNDTHGHQAGDEVLVAVSQRLIDATRATDCAIRWGGEEFLVMFPETSLEEAAVIVERFRAHLGTEPVSVLDGVLRLDITASGGVSELEPGDTLESLVARADGALYRAKETGRNRLLLSSGGELVSLVA